MTVGRTAFALAVLCTAGAAAASAQQPGSARSRGAQGAPSQCVVCHGRLGDSTGAGHGFAAWRGSPHAAAGVACVACHGGNASATDAATAHQGVRPSRDPSSPVFFTSIPNTCGRCHAAEAGYFRTSLHFARLESDGRGPNCVTCHGSMATSVLTAERLLATCSACHVEGGVAPPEKAREAARVLALVQAENVLYDVVSTEAAARRGSGGAARAAVLLGDAQRHLSAAAEVWHSFLLDSAAARLGDARKTMVEAWEALGHPAPSASIIHRAPRGAGTGR